MANYGLYKDVDEGQLSSDASTLTESLTKGRSELSNFKGTLTDDIWKAGAKATLLTAFDTLDTDVYENLINDLATITSIAGEIANYKSAEGDAKAAQTAIDEAEAGREAALKADPNADVSGYDKTISDETAAKTTAEGKMDEAEAKVNALNV